MIKIALIILTLSIFTNKYASAQAVQFYQKTKNPPLELQFPVMCTLEEDCFILNYPDLDESEEFRDFKDGKFTYDGHNGTDIAIKNIKEMQTGISVLAADDGVVIFVRDGIKDNIPTENEEEKPDNPPGCGNAIIMEHNNGWQTLYCHLKKGSISVKEGSFRRRGQQIAEVGISGNAEWPHLHFGVIHDKTFYDPFSGLSLAGSDSFKPFWNVQTQRMLKYKPLTLYIHGVSNEFPEVDKIINGDYQDLEIQYYEPDIYLWSYAFHINAGDFIKINVSDSDSQKLLSKALKVKSNEKEKIYVAKLAKEGNEWKPGTYKSKIELLRPDRNIFQEYKKSFKVNPPISEEIENNREQQIRTAIRGRKKLNLQVRLFNQKRSEFLKQITALEAAATKELAATKSEIEKLEDKEKEEGLLDAEKEHKENLEAFKTVLEANIDDYLAVLAEKAKEIRESNKVPTKDDTSNLETEAENFEKLTKEAREKVEESRKKL